MRKLLFAFILFICLFQAYSQWIEINLPVDKNVLSSSDLKELVGGVEIIYSAENIFDNKIETTWIEGAPGNGIGEYIIFIVNSPIEGFNLINGSAKNYNQFQKNNRIKKLKITPVVGFTSPSLVKLNAKVYSYFMNEAYHKEGVLLKDTTDKQFVLIPYSKEEQKNFIKSSLEKFSMDFPAFYQEIKDNLNLGNSILPIEIEDIIASFSIYGFKIEIVEIYKGIKNDNAGITEIIIQ